MIGNKYMHAEQLLPNVDMGEFETVRGFALERLQVEIAEHEEIPEAEKHVWVKTLREHEFSEESRFNHGYAKIIRNRKIEIRLSDGEPALIVKGADFKIASPAETNFLKPFHAFHKKYSVDEESVLQVFASSIGVDLYGSYVTATSTHPRRIYSTYPALTVEPPEAEMVDTENFEDRESNHPRIRNYLGKEAIKSFLSDQSDGNKLAIAVSAEIDGDSEWLGLTLTDLQRDAILYGLTTSILFALADGHAGIAESLVSSRKTLYPYSKQLSQMPQAGIKAMLDVAKIGKNEMHAAATEVLGPIAGSQWTSIQNKRAARLALGAFETSLEDMYSAEV